MKVTRSTAPQLAPLAIFLAAFALYLTSLAPGMLRGDSGEFQWAMASLNVAHATGYPLFTLLGYGWQLVPLSSNIAWQLNLLAPFFAALAAATLFVLIRSVTSRSDAGLVGALFFALAPVMWFNASILEVYSLHAFLLALTIYFLWRWSQDKISPTASSVNRENTKDTADVERSDGENAAIVEAERHDPSMRRASDWALYVACFLLGLALAHHRLTVLALPAFLYFLFVNDPRFLHNVRRLLLCIALVVPGLLLYLYVPLRLLPEGFSLDYSFYDIILGREYATSLLREINPLPVLVEIPFKNFHIGLVLALVGAVTLFRRAKHLNVALWLIYLADIAFALVYSVPDIEVFLTSSFVVTAIWIGVGSAFLLDRLRTRVGSPNGRRAAMALAILLLVVPLLGLVRYGEIRAAVSNEGAPEVRARAIAAANLPEGALLELDWETATALRFLQTTEKLRPDLDARLIEMDRRDEFWRALYNVDAGRAVFVESGVKWTRAPAGFVTEEREEDLSQIVRVPIEMTRLGTPLNERVELLGYQSKPAALTLFWQVHKPLDKDLATFVHYLDAAGEKIGQDDRAACCEAVYSYRTSEWEAGQVYADVFKPAPPNTVSLLVGMYENANGDIEPYGETIEIRP